ncbi:P-loop containing nucleoside triphosphate hydrolase protein [Polyporus arcularius HHB13444]|uniref:DNA 3'-5' helicase n=1 Tax=Polyporus arcularius HHB13444 TaxID=1314778 RepID=A0A5C3PRH8_9APHY|nr:P-loop containing nucleoside triphosphate hydrolase protein [Polyporus arcularius HHB13444]
MPHSDSYAAAAALDRKRLELARKNLENARQEAAVRNGYDYQATRRLMTTKFAAVSGGKIPYDWQLDVAEAMHLGLDCVVIAGTGAGKTIPYLLPLLLPANAKKTIPVISPLKSLQQDQAKRFNKHGVSARAVNEDTWSQSLKEEILSHTHRALFLGPEMCLAQSQARETLRTLGLEDSLEGFVIDEAHCIVQWGGEFRPLYAELGALRTFTPRRRPLAAFSATMAPSVLAKVEETLLINPSTSFYVNLGNDRPNIYQDVVMMQGSKDYAALDRVLPLKDVSRVAEIPKTLVFTNSRKAAMHVWKHLKEALPSHLAQSNAVDLLHAYRRRRARQGVMELFRAGEVRILVATEAAGMGMDIPDIETVIQFGAPPSLTTWIQRAGRAGRGSGVIARAVLLLEKSVFEVIKKRAPDKQKNTGQAGEVVDVAPGEGGGQYRKKIERALRAWLECAGCRREAANEYFNNPIVSGFENHHGTRCCDRCCRVFAGLSQDGVSHESAALALSLSPPPPISSSPRRRARSSSSVCNTLTPSKRRRENIPMDDRESTPSPDSEVSSALQLPTRKVRTLALRKAAIAALEAWRLRIIRADYSATSFTEEGLLSDDMIKSLVHDATLTTVQDIERKLKDPPWIFASIHGQDVLEVLRGVDAEYPLAAASRKPRSRRQVQNTIPESDSDSDTENHQHTASPSHLGPSTATSDSGEDYWRHFSPIHDDIVSYPAPPTAPAPRRPQPRPVRAQPSLAQGSTPQDENNRLDALFVRRQAPLSWNWGNDSQGTMTVTSTRSDSEPVPQGIPGPAHPLSLSRVTQWPQPSAFYDPLRIVRPR